MSVALIAKKLGARGRLERFRDVMASGVSHSWTQLRHSVTSPRLSFKRAMGSTGEERQSGEQPGASSSSITPTFVRAAAVI